MCREIDCTCDKRTDCSPGLQSLVSSSTLINKSKTGTIKVEMNIQNSSDQTLLKDQPSSDFSSLQIENSSTQDAKCDDEIEDEQRSVKEQDGAQSSATKFSSIQEDTDNVKKVPQKKSSSSTGNKTQTDAFREIRMERKRKREMQRRSSVNRELDNLAELINKINPPELKSSNDKFSEANNHPTLNRLDLIHVAVKVLGRLHQQTEQDAQRINELTLELNTMKDMLNRNDKVNLMFPVMVPSNESSEDRMNGGQVPNGSVFLSPRMPNSYLNANPPPTLHKGAPFPQNSIFSSSFSNFLPTTSQNLLNKIGDHLPQNQSYPPHNPNLFFLPDPRLRGTLETNRLLNLNQQDLEALLAAKLAEQLSKKPL